MNAMERKFAIFPVAFYSAIFAAALDLLIRGLILLRAPAPRHGGAGRRARAK
jgi:hypothetical protein